jgi:AcrR family transcriptional regulator
LPVSPRATAARLPRARRTQEERSAGTRAALLDATVASLVEVGYAATTTTEVCARAGLSRGAQLHHFPTRADLVVHAVAHLAKRRADEVRLELRIPDDAPDRLSRALDAVWASFSGPLFYAALELWVASRSDAALRANLIRFERKVGRAMAGLWRELAGPEASHAPHFEDLLELTFHVMRGMALQRILRDDDTERRRLFELWKRLVSASLDIPRANPKERTR